LNNLFLVTALITLSIGLFGCGGPKEPLDEAFVFSNLEGETTVPVFERHKSGTRTKVSSIADGDSVSLIDSARWDGFVFYQIDLGNDERGWINRINIFADRQGVVPYEHESVDAMISRYDNFSHKLGPSFGNYFNVCSLVDAAFASDQEDFRSKDEFETTQEYEQKVNEYKEQRRYHKDLSRGITFVTKDKISGGSYDADTETMSLEKDSYAGIHYCDLPVPKRYRYWNGGYSKEVDSLYPWWYGPSADEVGFKTGSFKVPRKIAKSLDVTKMAILRGAKFKDYKHYWKSESQMTRYEKREGITEYYMSFSTDHSFFVIALPDKTFANAYFSEEYKKTWIRDLKIQLISFGYDAGDVVNSIDDELQVALNQAKEDGLVTKSEPAIERVMELLLEDKPRSYQSDRCYPEEWAVLANPKRQQKLESWKKTGKEYDCVERREL
jgi:hypothetical protein